MEAGTGFNPRTHEECDREIIFHGLIPQFQSTHSRGVRPILPPFDKLCSCFNPRTHEECDDGHRCALTYGCCFNPRTHEECDNFYFFLGNAFGVSIHALTRSATSISVRESIKLFLFQSTHSRGVRHIKCTGVNAYRGFNPRTHEECDSGKSN